MAAYAFADVRGAIVGPGGSFPFGSGNCVAEEGIEIEKSEKSGMVIGADGCGQHNIYADESGTITIRLLKTSPTNAQFQTLYDFQKLSAVNAGENLISIYNLVTGDQITARQCAFRQFTRNSYAKEGPVMEWVFNCINITEDFGAGVPVLA